LELHSRADPEAAVDIVEFLLGWDERVKLQRYSQSQGLLSLSTFAYAYLQDYNDANIGTALKIIKAIYDAHPQAEVASNIHRCHPQVQTFVTDELDYSLQAKDIHFMMTPDGNGQLPLHTALENNVRLGSIKLLVGGYPPAVQSPDHNGALPLHIACAHHESATVLQYMIELDTTTLEAVDEENNTALHYACRGAKFETITLLLEKYGAVSVSQRNAQKKLPIDLLWESSEVVDRECVEYMGSIFQLLKAYPEIVVT
jgi:ankyrin repeat protein